MKVSQGALGRVLVVRLDDGEDIIESVVQAAQAHGVRAAVVWALGAARRGEMVVGPRRTEIPPERWTTAFDEGREMVALGTLFPCEGRPSLHLHAATGRGQTTLTGCLQRGAQAFLIVEAVIVEILDCPACRKPDASGRFNLLDLPGG
jgi:predicted DNA-binding protein with PD1-like motif